MRLTRQKFHVPKQGAMVMTNTATWKKTCTFCPWHCQHNRSIKGGHLENVSLRTKWIPQRPHLLHVRNQLDTCHPPNLVMTLMTHELERLLGWQVKALWINGEERRRSSARDTELHCGGLSVKMTRGVGAPELVEEDCTAHHEG